MVVPIITENQELKEIEIKSEDLNAGYYMLERPLHLTLKALPGFARTEEHDILKKETLVWCVDQDRRIILTLFISEKAFAHIAQGNKLPYMMEWITMRGPFFWSYAERML